MKPRLRRGTRALLAGLTGGVAVGPLAAFGLRSLFLLQGVTFRWVLILCTIVAAVAAGTTIWVADTQRSDGP